MFPILLLSKVFWLDNTAVTLAEAIGEVYVMNVAELTEGRLAKKYLKIFKKN